MKMVVRRLTWVLSAVAAIVLVVFVFFALPYSQTVAAFKRTASNLVLAASGENAVFSEDDIRALPEPVQKYFAYCGYLGKPKMSYVKWEFRDVAFVMDRTKQLKIDYVQYNFTPEPNRIALIDTSVFGIPFEGFDSFVAGQGGMKGVLGKAITLFDEKGPEMDKACLATYLSECLVFPAAALQEYIAWEAIDDTHAKATISYYGITASGIFTFSEVGEMLAFTTNDRAMTMPDGTFQLTPWTAILGDYRETNGILWPNTMQAVWHFEDGDLIYFDARNPRVEFGY